jgi:hypothetical protein
MMIDVKYFNADNFQDKDEYNSVFEPTPIDQEILKDTGYYRVLDLSPGLSAAFNNGAISAYFHKSIGGYHPAKLSIYQDLIEKQLYNYPDCRPTLNMLNARYIIIPPTQQGESVSLRLNDQALGAAWFVKEVKPLSTPAQVMSAITYLHPKDTALVLEKDKGLFGSFTGSSDSTASIALVNNDNDRITYTSRSTSTGFGVFSEIYYEDGWVATIDGKMVELSARELGLLEVLLQRAGRLVSKDQLVDRLCEWGEEVSNNAIEVYVHRLRKKIEKGPIRIATVRGLGYCLEKIPG